MSAFLFKQTETAGADCACGARTLGRSIGPALRARARAHTSRRLRRAGLGRDWPGRAGRKAVHARGLAVQRRRLVAGWSRQGAAGGTALAPAGCGERSRAPETERRSG